jgi:hypothetical protein
VSEISELDEHTVHLLQDLTTRYGLDVPAEALEGAGISAEQYAAWRMDLADEESNLRDMRALADNIDAANQPGALPPRRPPEEVAEIERREEEAQRRDERRDQASWLKSDEDEPT